MIETIKHRCIIMNKIMNAKMASFQPNESCSSGAQGEVLQCCAWPLEKIGVTAEQSSFITSLMRKSIRKLFTEEEEVCSFSHKPLLTIRKSAGLSCLCIGLTLQIWKLCPLILLFMVMSDEILCLHE